VPVAIRVSAHVPIPAMCSLAQLRQRTYWLLPLTVGIPLIVRALLWHPLVPR